MTKKRCAAQHFGMWACESKWLAQALAAVQAGRLLPENTTEDEDDAPYELAGPRKDIAVVRIQDQITKQQSSFGGTSSVGVRRAIRGAVADTAVESIFLLIDSPGGTVAGTGDLAADVARANEKKPVYAYIEDMGASAAYWIASQARKVYANPTAQIGSIGTYAVLEDSTGAQEAAGIKLTVVSTGKYKGLGADGKVTDALVEDVQREVDDLNAKFMASVGASRGIGAERMAEIADGRVWIADQAQKLGLIDEIASVDAAIGALDSEVSTMNRSQFDAFAAENPEAVAVHVEQGKKAGHAEGGKAERARCLALAEAVAHTSPLLIESIRIGREPEQLAAIVAAVAAENKATADALAAKDKEIERLNALVGSQGAVNTTGAAGKAEAPAPAANPEAKAKAEWDAMTEESQSAWVDEATFVRVRAKELAQ